MTDAKSLSIIILTDYQSYCKFRNFREGFIFKIFVKIKSSWNAEITLSFTDISKSCHSHEFFASQMCLLRLFAKIKFL